MDEISRFTRHVVALRLLGEGAKGWTSPEHDVKRLLVGEAGGRLRT